MNTGWLTELKNAYRTSWLEVLYNNQKKIKIEFKWFYMQNKTLRGSAVLYLNGSLIKFTENRKMTYWLAKKNPPSTWKLRILTETDSVTEQTNWI